MESVKVERFRQTDEATKKKIAQEAIDLIEQPPHLSATAAAKEVAAKYNIHFRTVMTYAKDQGTPLVLYVPRRDGQLGRHSQEYWNTLLPWSDRRDLEAGQAGATAEKIRTLVDQAIDPDSDLPEDPQRRKEQIVMRLEAMKKVKDLAIAYAIFIDKAQLLTGGATSRGEQITRKSREDAAKEVIGILQGLKDRASRGEIPPSSEITVVDRDD